MNTSLGYAKRTLTDTSVLLSGGGDKPLSNFIGSISWDSTNKKITYTPVGGNATDLVSFGSNAFNSNAFIVKSDILNYLGEPNTDTNLNNRYSLEKFYVTGWSYSHHSYILNQPKGDRASTAATVISIPGLYPWLIYRDYNSNNYYVRGYYSGTGWTAWNRIALTDEAPTAHTHPYTDLTGSGTTANLAILSNGTANGWKLTTLGSMAFENKDNYALSTHNHDERYVKFYLSPMAGSAPADSAKSWFVNTMPSSSGAIVYNVPGSEKTIIAGKSSGAYGHMLQLSYDDAYLRILRYKGGTWQSTDWEKISAGYADSAGNADTVDGYHAINLGRIFSHTIQSSKAVRISFDSIFGAIISVRRTNGSSGLILIGTGYGENTIRNTWAQISPSSRFRWSVPATDSLSKTIEISNPEGNLAYVSVMMLNNATPTFTEIDTLYSTGQDCPIAYTTSNVASANYATTAGAVAWDNVSGKPNSFNPSAHDHDDRYITALGTDGEYVTWTKNGTANNLTVPYASYTGRFKSHGTSNWDANNLTYPIAENYGQSGGSSNYPGGYGSVFQILASGGSLLGGQFFWSINHNSTSSTNNLYFRAGNNLGWQNDWKRIAWASEIPTSMAWSSITSKPDTATRWPTWDEVTDKPTAFTPSTHDHTYIKSKDNYTFTADTLPNSFDYGVSAGFVNSNAGFGSYGSVLTVRTYSGGGGSLQLYAPYSATYGGTHLKARFGNYESSSGNSWTTLKDIAWVGDIPTKVSQLTNDSGFITSSGSCASATSAGSATNIAGGAQGSIPYLTAAGTTAFLAGGTNGYVLAYNTTSKAPYWKADSNTQYYLTLNGTTKGTANTNDLGTIYAPTSSGTGFLKCSVSGTTVTWSYDNSTYLTSHYTATPVLGGSSATSNATSNTSDPYLNIVENSTKSGGILLKGGGSTSVTAKNGIATISSTNTLYYLTLNGSVNGTASTNDLGTIYAPTTAGTGFLKGTAGANGAITWSWDNSTYNNYSLPTATASALGGVKVGTTLTSDTGYTKVHIKDGFIYYKDTNTWQAANTSQVGYVPSTSANTMLYANSSGSATWGTPDLYEVNVGGNVDTAETLTEKIAYGGVLGFYFGGGMLGWLDEDGININHASSALGATTIGSSTASSGSTVDIPYILTDEYGHVTAGGTHTHTISVSGYLPTGGGELTGSLTLPKTTLAIKFNTRTGAGIKYDYGGNEALMISARAYSAASILLYAGESSTTRSLDNNSGQWSAGSSASNYMGVPNMQIKNGSVLINTAVQTGTLSGEYANALYVTGNAYLKGSSGSDNGMLTHNGTRYALFGTGASGATGIWVQGIGNDGWIVGVNPSGTPFFNGNANSATSATSATSASYASYLTFDSSKTCASANHSFTYYNTNTSTTSSSTNGVANPEASKWFHHISMVRGDTDGYFFDLAFSLSEWSTPRIYFRNRSASNYSTWKEIVTSANYTEYFTGGGGSIDLNHKTFSSLGSSTYYRLAYVYLSGTSNTTLSTLYYTSGLYVNNSGVYHTSDIAYKEAIRKYLLKKNVLDLENPVKKFKWKGTNDEAVGFIAQETEEWCPEAVGQDEDGYKTVNYTVALSGLCSALYDEVKTLRKEIEELKDKK